MDIDNWMITLGGALLFGVSLLGAAALMRAARRGMSGKAARPWWLALFGAGGAAVTASLLLDLESGPAEAIALLGGIGLIVLGGAIPRLNKRITKAEENRMSAKDL